MTKVAVVQGAQLVVFPEAFVGGYPKGIDFGSADIFEGAIDAPGAYTDRLGEGGALYCTVLFFSPDGLLCAKHRKPMPTAMERLNWGYGDGSRGR